MAWIRRVHRRNRLLVRLVEYRYNERLERCRMQIWKPNNSCFDTRSVSSVSLISCIFRVTGASFNIVSSFASLCFVVNGWLLVHGPLLNAFFYFFTSYWCLIAYHYFPAWCSFLILIFLIINNSNICFYKRGWSKMYEKHARLMGNGQARFWKKDFPNI